MLLQDEFGRMAEESVARSNQKRRKNYEKNTQITGFHSDTRKIKISRNRSAFCNAAGREDGFCP